MIRLSAFPPDNVKMVHCPVCGGRLCDVKKNEKICLDKERNASVIVVKCYKCGNKISISIK